MARLTFGVEAGALVVGRVRSAIRLRLSPEAAVAQHDERVAAASLPWDLHGNVRREMDGPGADTGDLEAGGWPERALSAELAGVAAFGSCGRVPSCRGGSLG